MEADTDFRICDETDAEAVLALWREADATVSPTDTIADIKQAVRHPAAVFLLATRGSQIIGSVIGTFDGWRGEIYRLVVHPRYQRQGVARSLVAEVERRIAERGARRITALVEQDHPWATGFWDAVRYQVDSRIVRYVRDVTGSHDALGSVITNQPQLREKQDFLTGLVVAGYVAGMLAVGLKLGLYRSLAEIGPVSARGLAESTGLHERWLLEWLRCQVAGGVIEHDDTGRFYLGAPMAALLSDEDAPTFAGAPFLTFLGRQANFEKLPQAFRTGRGFTWDDQGSWAIEASERSRKNWYRDELVQHVLPQMEGVVEKLTKGAKVVDLGCGTGMALLELAQAFPRSAFLGYEVSEVALGKAVEYRRAAGLDNLEFHHAVREPLPEDGSFDLALTCDCLHDMAHPDRAARSIRRALRADGVWFILEVACEPTFEENLASNPVQTASRYAPSLLTCLPSGMTEPDGAGLGTLGLPEPAMRTLAQAAGFTRFRRLPLPSTHALYEARP